jgi:hypothetical protein
VISQRDNGPKSKSLDFGSQSRGFESRMGGSAGAGARYSVFDPQSSVLGPRLFGAVGASLLLVAVDVLNCPVLLTWRRSICHLCRTPLFWRPLVHSAPTAHTEWGARPQPRAARPAHRPSSPRIDSSNSRVSSFIPSAAPCVAQPPRRATAILPACMHAKTNKKRNTGCAATCIFWFRYDTSNLQRNVGRNIIVSTYPLPSTQ